MSKLLCPKFWQIQTFGYALALPAPAPLISWLIFNKFRWIYFSNHHFIPSLRITRSELRRELLAVKQRCEHHHKFHQITTNYHQITTNYHQITTNYHQITTNYHQPICSKQGSWEQTTNEIFDITDFNNKQNSLCTVSGLFQIVGGGCVTFIRITMTAQLW